MMDYLQSFSLRDFLIFSPESYFKLFELYNAALWPFHIPLALLTCIVVILLYKRHPYASWLTFIWLGLVWGFVAKSYFGEYYSQLATYANVLSYGFWAQCCLLLLVAFTSSQESIHSLSASRKKWQLFIGVGLIIYGLLLHPFVSIALWNQPFSRVELFSIAPDPTAIASIGFILLLPLRGYRMLITIPCLWLMFSVITYLAF